MKNFVWVVDSEQSSQFGLGGVSETYILPRSIGLEYSSQLSGKRIWVLLRGASDRLFLTLSVKSVEEITENYYKGDFIIQIDLCASIRLAKDFHSAEQYQTTYFDEKPIGISDVSSELEGKLDSLVKSSVRVKLVSPRKKDFEGVKIEIAPLPDVSLARQMTRLIVANFSLNQMWGLGGTKAKGPIPHFAHQLLVLNGEESVSDGIDKHLSKLDPLGTLHDRAKGKSNKSNKTTKPPKVDLDFTQIDPQKIYTRKFIGISGKHFDLLAALEKTGRAEAKHQEILKDISKYLISKNVIPYDSNSIDLMFKNNKQINAFEIKSANLDNILAQAAKGAFQVSCYCEALKANFGDARIFLILETIGNSELEGFAKRVLSSMNVTVLFYDASKQWPHKIMDFPFQ